MYKWQKVCVSFPNSLKNVQIFRVIVKCETFFTLKDELLSLVECTRNNFSCWFFLEFFLHFLAYIFMHAVFLLFHFTETLYSTETCYNFTETRYKKTWGISLWARYVPAISMITTHYCVPTVYLINFYYFDSSHILWFKPRH